MTIAIHRCLTIVWSAMTALLIPLSGCKEKAPEFAHPSSTKENFSSVFSDIARFAPDSLSGKYQIIRDSILKEAVLHPGTDTTRYSVFFPRIIEPQDSLAMTLDSLLRNLSYGTLDSLNASAEDLFARNKEDADSFEAAAYFISNTLQVHYLNRNFLVCTRDYEDEFGGAHGSYFRTADIIPLTDLSKRLGLKELFTPDEIARLTKCVSDSLELDERTTASEADTLSLTDNAFYFDSSGIYFEFQKYSSILGGATIRISWAGLKETQK